MYKFAITRPVATLMFALAVIFFGVNALKRMPVALFPNIDFPIVLISTLYPGASAETVETKVTDKIEEAVMGIDGIEKVTSSSVRNASIVIIEFKLEKDLEEAANDVRDKVGTVRLDTGVQSPVVRKFDTGSAPIISLFLTSEKISPSEMMSHADQKVKPILQKIQGVGGVSMRGYRARQIKIYPDPTLMSKYGLTYSDISSRLGLENVEVDSGRIIGAKREWSLTTDANAKNLNELKEARIAAGVKLSDVAVVEDSIEEERTYANFGKVPGVVLEVQKIAGQNDINIANAVRASYAEILSISPGYDISIFNDTTQYIKESINDVVFDLILGGVLATLIVFVFLRSVTITIVAALSLPVSIIGTFALMNLFGVTINMLSLLAFTLSIGIIIDDAIVVIENIHKKLEAGMSKREAAYEGVREIGFAIIAISAMLLSVFVSIGTMEGMVGRIFRDFGVTVSLAVGLSYIVVITVIPMLSSIVVSPKHSNFYHKTDPFFKKLDEIYVKTLYFVLRFKAITVAAVFIFFVGTLVLASKLGMEFMLKEDKSEYQAFIEAKPGISMAQMKTISLALQDIAIADPDTDYATLQIGYNDQKNIFRSRLYVRMKTKKERATPRTQFDTMKEVGEKMRAHELAKGLRIAMVDVSAMGGGDNSPFQLAINNADESKVDESVENLIKLLETHPELAGRIGNIHTNKTDKQPEYRLKILRQNADKYGLTAQAIGNALRSAMSGEYAVGYFRESGKEYDITIAAPDDKRKFFDDIKRIQVRNGFGELMFLEGLVEIEESQMSTVIARFNRQRSTTVYAVPERDSGLTLNDALNIVLSDKSWLVDGTTATLQGEAKSGKETAEAFLAAVLTSVVLIYLILAALYESFIQPIIIMVTLPLSFSGAFIAMAIVGQPFSMFAFMGLIVLMGLVGKNATLIIDVANEKRAEGHSRDESIIAAGESRLRPIMMTTFAMVFSMIPLAIASGAGAAMKSPVGITMIGGLMVALALSLLVVPAFYKALLPLDEKLKSWYKPKADDKF